MPPKLILVVCEGDSEYGFLNSMNRYLRENAQDERFAFVRENMKGINVNNFTLKITNALRRREGHFHKVCVWLDLDIFKRAYPDKSAQDIIKDCAKQIQKDVKFHKGITADSEDITICFNFMNGEDFIAACYPKDVYLNWYNFCRANNHFECPMVAADYKPKAKELIPNFDNVFVLFEYLGTKEALINLLNNHNTVRPVSYFVEIIKYTTGLV